MSKEIDQSKSEGKTKARSEKMAASVPPPEKFSFAPAEWDKWRNRFIRFMNLSGNEERGDKEKLDCLLYCMGDRAEDIILQFEKNITYEQALENFTSYFLPKKNVVFERFKFNSRNQKEGEPVEEFITELYKLAETCEYNDLKEDLIRDRIVIGIIDKRTSERLQLKNDLQLKEAILICKQAEMQKKECLELLNKPDLEVNRMKAENQIKDGCWFCGQNRHPKNQCIALKSKCFKCGRTGHFARYCRSGSSVFKVGEIQNKYITEMGVYNNATHIDNMDFLIDTGADVTAIPETHLHRLQLVPCDDKVKGPDGKLLNVIGTSELRLVYKNKVYLGKVHVIKGLKCAILGRPAIENMNILYICAMSGNESNYETSKVNVEQEFPNIFDELGVFKDKFHIKLIDNPQYSVQTTARNVSIPLLPKVKEELDKLERLGIISPIEEPTDFVSPIVVVYKNNKVRICGDYTKVNQNIKRPIYPIPKVENTLAKLKGAKYFSKIDATSGFHQIQLDEESKKLTSIITPFGRYIYNRLPFGLNCAPEYFSMKFNNLFQDLDIAIHMDDILIYEETLEKHDKKLREVLHRLEKEGLTINKSKCIFGAKQISYLGHVVSEQGIMPDPERIKAIGEFETPTNKKQLLQFLGMVNFVGRFIPNKSHILDPLHALLKENNMFIWGSAQELAFREIKEKLQKAPVLAHFDPSKKIIVSADSSSYGLGAALMQETSTGQRSVVGYASRTLTEAEKHYAQIEKECLALAWSVDRFKDYVVGIEIVLETDHKPLLQILQTKPLDDLTPRLLRFRLKLMRFMYKVKYTPGKELSVADALSRNPLPSVKQDSEDSVSEHIFNLCVNDCVPNDMLNKIKREQENSTTHMKLKEYTIQGWPNKNKLGEDLIMYYQHRNNFTVEDNILLYNSRIVVPEILQKDVLARIHTGHLGISKCRERAKQSVWWIGLSKNIEEVVISCPKCIECRVNHKEEMVVDEFPDRAWQKIGMDLFKYNNWWYLVMIDYYSRFLEIFKLNDLTEDSVISKCRETFARYGFPEVVRTDCGSQFKTKFQTFAKENEFQAITSSPYFAQSNGLAEAGVKIAKSLLSKNDDMYQGLLVYRNTPLESGYSPAELMFNRKLRDNLPIIPSTLNKTVHISENYREERDKKRHKDAGYYNKRHRASNLPELNVNDRVWVIDLKVYGTIREKCSEPRSFIIKTERGTFRRNRWNLVLAPCNNSIDFESPVIENEDLNISNPEREDQVEPVVNEQASNDDSKSMERRRLIKKPNYLKDYVC